MHDLHGIQGPNVTRDTREKIAFFAFHAFVVEDSRFQQNRVRAKLDNCGACVCKSNVEIRIAGSFCRPQKHVPCLCRVIQTRVKVWENEKCCWNTSRRRVFPQLFRVLVNFHECLYNSVETEYMFSISFRKQHDEKKENNLLTC